jgi:hypothetical protein
MPEDEDEEEGEDDEVYEFVATGEHSCERCLALDGTLWEQPPNPPHAHCECEVQVRRKGARKPGQSCEDTTWSFENISAASYGESGSQGFEWGYLVTVECWDGPVYEFEIWIDMGQLSDWPVTDSLEAELEGYAWNEMYDEVEAVIANVCAPCSQDVVS